MQKQIGFTLVEIAIVLIIIGLLLGSILKSQELILNSRIQRTISEYEQLSTAILTYQDRYRQLPGDDNLAQTRWGNTVSNGNGNRLLEGTWDSVNGTTETSILWHHLRNDGLLSGQRNNSDSGSFIAPNNAFNGQIGIQQNAFGTLQGLVLCQGNVPAKAARIIDSRLDDDGGDGLGSASGNIQAGNNTQQAPVTQYRENETYILCRIL